MIEDFDKKLDKEIEKKLKEIEEATEKARVFYAKNAPPKGKFGDFFEMAEAFDTESLKVVEYEILLAKRYKIKNWEEAINSLEKQAEALRSKIKFWKKREFPKS